MLPQNKHAERASEWEAPEVSDTISSEKVSWGGEWGPGTDPSTTKNFSENLWQTSGKNWTLISTFQMP